MPSATESRWSGTCLWPQHLWGEPGGSQGHPWLHSLFSGSLGHMRPCWGREREGERLENGREIDSQVEVGRLSLCIRLPAVSQHWVTVADYVTKKNSWFWLTFSGTPVYVTWPGWHSPSLGEHVKTRRQKLGSPRDPSRAYLPHLKLPL